jgi:predicted amidophosphoribosyltransferase
MQSSSRCPRCGFPLRYTGGAYRCDFCGFPNTRQPLTNSIRNLERNFRSRVQSLLQEHRAQQYERMIVQYPYTAREALCVSCGNRIPYGAQVCPYCAAPQAPPQPNQAPTANPPTMGGDQRVLDYIVAHDGTISISQAAKDLSITPDALRMTLERLKSSGVLKQT